jgi:alpha-tubulin suppressor-like RCC1 family protein
MLGLALAAALLATLCTGASARTAGAGLSASPLVTNPKITKQPSNTTVEAPAPASFTATASNSTGVQWEQSVDGGTTWQPISGATSTTYTIAATSISENGYEFRALFTNAEGGSERTKAATLTVNAKPVVTQQPVSVTVEQNHEAVFESRASGSPTPSIQWQVSTDGGQTFKNTVGSGNTLRIGSAGENMDGWEFRVVFKNTRGEAVSEAATLHVVEAPVLTVQPHETTVTEGQSASFFSSARGRPQPTAQWEVSTNAGGSWEAVEGATSSSLTLAATTGSEDGNLYRVRYTNSQGSTVSQAAKLNILSKPRITEQPQSQIVAVGGDATFSAEAIGPPAPTVQWELSTNEGASWSQVEGATADELTVSNVQLSESGREYRAVFTNSAGTTTSETALLTVATTDYRGYGWGVNTHGQAGVGSSEAAILAPTPAGGLQFVTSLAAGSRHSLALLANGTVESWGYNGHGQLGDEGANASKSPIPVEDLRGVTAIAAGANHSVALLKNGTVKAWGDDESGQLGDGKQTDSEVPVAVSGLSGVTAIAAGYEHTLALLSNGTVEAWGNNELGQLGTGNTHSSTTPVPVPGLSGVIAISANDEYSMALLSDGTVMAWGDDAEGQLGNTSIFKEEISPGEEEGLFSDTPVPVEDLSGVTAIAAGATHALALLEDGTVEAWGDDREGELGNGAIEPKATNPVPVIGLANVKSIAAGEDDSAAVLSSGTLMTWGGNAHGTLGLGTESEPVDAPTQVTALGMVVGVSVGGGQMIAFGEEQPAVSAVIPSMGPTAGGTAVTITGSDLADTSAVHFGSTPAASYEVVSVNEIKAVSPPGSGTVNVTVTTPAGTSPPKPGNRFAYIAKATVAKLSVKGGPATGGTVVTITGTGFLAPAEVHFGEAEATSVTVNSSTSITATTTAMASGKLAVTVTTPGGTSAPGKATFKSTPVITSVSPPNGPLAGGNTVTITGAGFAPGANLTAFKFGKSKAKTGVQCESTSSCTVLVPAGKAAGTVDVTLEANKAKSTTSEADRYTYE